MTFNREEIDQEGTKTESRIIEIKRVSKKTKGGNQISFTALVVAGDKEGKLGIALSKAKDVQGAIIKAERKAKRTMAQIALEPKNKTIPYPVEIKYEASRILLKPAKAGTGLIAGGPIRIMAELAGIENIVAKIFGSRNKTTIVYGTYKAFLKFAKND